MGRAPAPPVEDGYLCLYGDFHLTLHTCTKLFLLGAAQLLVLVVDIEIPGELLVVLDPVPGLLALRPVPSVALHSAVDDVDCGAKTRADSVSAVLTKHSCYLVIQKKISYDL